MNKLEKYLPKKKTEVQFNGEIKFDSSAWKHINVIEVQREFENRFNDIQKKIGEFEEDFYWNKLVYESEIKIEPKIGNVYHLYEVDEDKRLLSIIAPNEWGMKHIGSFKLTINRKWQKINYLDTNLDIMSK